MLITGWERFDGRGGVLSKYLTLKNLHCLFLKLPSPPNLSPAVRDSRGREERRCEGH